IYLPYYRIWIVAAAIIICFFTWLLIEKTRLGSYLRAGAENSNLVRSFGVNVPLVITVVYGLGVGLAALSGVMAAPIYKVTPMMGGTMITIVFAVVVIGGMGSLKGSIFSGFALGVIEGVTKAYYPEAATISVFLVMIAVLV